MEQRIALPLTKKAAAALRCGDRVLLSGMVYTARDAAHQRIVELLKAQKPLPFSLQDAIIYYVGPTPAKPGEIIGSAGPTTSFRMDTYTPLLLEHGLRGMIGKGDRSLAVIDAIKRNNAVYFAALGGAGALLSEHITSARVAAFGELGPEAVFELTLADFPAIVAIDSAGNNLYEIGPVEYLLSKK